MTLVLGFPGTLLTRYLDSFNVGQALTVVGIGTGSELYWRAITFYWGVAYFIFFLYLFYFIRYFRLRIVAARTQLSPLLSGGEHAYNRAFSNVHNHTGAIVTSIIIGIAFAPSVYRLVINSLGPISAAHVIISQIILDFAGGTGIWLFFSSIWSLYKLGKEPMVLKPSSEDQFFGLASIGSITLALALIYFGALGIRGLGILASGIEIMPWTNVVFEVVLTFAGMVLLLAAVHSFRKKMVSRKELERSEIYKQRMIIYKSATNRNIKTAEKLVLLDIIERRLENSHTWPFDKSVLNHLSSIMISVTAIMLARIFSVVFRI